MSEDVKKDNNWLLDRNSKFRSAFNLLANVLFMFLIIVFFIDYNAAKNSFQYSQLQDGLEKCKNFPYIYLIVGKSNLDTALNSSPLILGYHCTNTLDTFASTVNHTWNFTAFTPPTQGPYGPNTEYGKGPVKGANTWPGITPSPIR